MGNQKRTPKKKEVAPGQGKATSKTPKAKVFHCSDDHIAKFRKEIREQGLWLPDTTNVKIQRKTLLLVLQYLGHRGIRTKEAEALGYYRIATRIQELEVDSIIDAPRENFIGPEGLFHRGNARYILCGPRAGFGNPQFNLDLGEA